MNVVNGNFITWLKINFKVNYFLLGLNILLGLVTLALTYLIFQGSDTLALIFSGGQVLPGTEPPFSAYVLQLWRFLTSAFLHAGIWHLLFNMYALYVIGNFVERFFGGRKLFMIYILTALGGSVLSFLGSLFNLWGNAGTATGVVVSVGASGAIFGLIGVILGNRFFKKHTYGPALNVDTNSLILIVAVNIALGFSANLLANGVVINNWAHIGGLITGIVLGAFLDTKNTYDISRFKKLIEKFLIVLSIILFILAWVLNLISIAVMSRSFVA